MIQTQSFCRLPMAVFEMSRDTIVGTTCLYGPTMLFKSALSGLMVCPM